MFKILAFILLSFTFTQSLFISEYSEGSSYNKYVEIYNPTDTDTDLQFLRCKIGDDSVGSPYVKVGNCQDLFLAL